MLSIAYSPVVVRKDRKGCFKTCGGPLKLEFEEITLRKATADNEQDVILADYELGIIAIAAWEGQD